MNISEIATHAHLLADAAETENIILMEVWLEKLVKAAPQVKKAFDKLMAETVEFQSELADFEARTEYQESLVMGGWQA
jgi:hypothetical protein